MDLSSACTPLAHASSRFAVCTQSPFSPTLNLEAQLHLPVAWQSLSVILPPAASKHHPLLQKDEEAHLGDSTNVPSIQPFTCSKAAS